MSIQQKICHSKTSARDNKNYINSLIHSDDATQSKLHACVADQHWNLAKRAIPLLVLTSWIKFDSTLTKHQLLN